MKIFVTDMQGTEHTLDAPAGWRVMEIIRDHGLPVKGECGGACACATCHVYVDEAWMERLPEISEEEESMIDGALSPAGNSRLSCQLIMSAELDGLRLRLSADCMP